MNDAQYRDFAASRESGGTTSRAFVRSLFALIAFGSAALLLTVIGYIYGALLSISSEFPFVLTWPFMLGAVIVILMFPLVGLLVGRTGFSKDNPGAAMVAGAVFGAASMIIVWVVAAGPDAGYLDWPGLLYLLQLTLSGAAAGLVLFSPVDRYVLVATNPIDGNRTASEHCEEMSMQGSSAGMRGVAAGRNRVFLVISILFLLAMSLPFLLMWQTRRGFREDAQVQAAEYFSLPSGFSLEVSDESSGVGSLEKNIRYRASGVQDEAGLLFSVDVIGERSDYAVDIKEIHASLKVPMDEISERLEWNDSEAGRRSQDVVLDLASTFVKTPLRIESVPAASSSGSSIVMRGDGIEVIARPGGVSPEASGVYFSFAAAPR